MFDENFSSILYGDFFVEEFIKMGWISQLHYTFCCEYHSSILNSHLGFLPLSFLQINAPIALKLIEEIALRLIDEILELYTFGIRVDLIS